MLTNLLMLLILVLLIFFLRITSLFIALMVLLKSTFLETHIFQMRTYLSKRDPFLIVESLSFLFNTFVLMVPRQNIRRHNVLGQNILREKTSGGTKQPEGQNVRQTKRLFWLYFNAHFRQYLLKNLLCVKEKFARTTLSVPAVVGGKTAKFHATVNSLPSTVAILTSLCHLQPNLFVHTFF
jgi:hypothetical protein